MSIQKLPAMETGPKWAIFVKVSDLLFLTEPIWVGAAGSMVYISIIFHLASFLPWLMLAIAFAPFSLRQIRLGFLTRRTPFEIPFIVFMAAIVVGMSVSDHFNVSLDAFQTYLAMLACFYCIINYPYPAQLMRWGLGTAVVGLVIYSAFYVVRDSYDTPHGLGIGLVIIAAIALGVAIFSKHTIARLASGLFCLVFLGLTIYFLSKGGSIHNFVTQGTIIGRLKLWQDVLSAMTGRSFWIGLGLGCWPVSSPWWGYGNAQNSYLELYINTGIPGIIAFICFAVVGAKLAVDIVYAPRRHPYYGFGVGVVLAVLATAAASTMEGAAFAIPGGGGQPYYMLSPIPLLLAGCLVVACRQLNESAETSTAGQRGREE